MNSKRYTAEQIINRFRGAELFVFQGKPIRESVDRDVAEALQSGSSAQLSGLPGASTADRGHILTRDVVTKVGAGQSGQWRVHCRSRAV